jgi:hypothetical protein
MAMLSWEERARVKAAHDKALASDPSLKKMMDDARRVMDEARKAMHEAMVKADPTIEPLLAKMGPLKPFKEGGMTPAQDHGGGKRSHPGMAGLTPEERDKIRHAHEQASSDPSVVSAREALEKASNPAQRDQAEQALRKASFEAMIKLDPSLAPILEKLRSEEPPSPNQPR